MIKARKREYYKKFKLEDNNYWQIVKDNRKPSVNKIDSQELADEINNTFYNIWKDVKQSDISYLIKEYHDDIPQHLCTRETVIKQLERLKSSSVGPDNLPANLLKAARLEIAECIAALFNMSLRHSFIPQQWKTAHITPIPKAINPTIADWRGINLIAILCKVLERIISKHIFQITKELWRLNNQYGFLPGCNTMDAIAQVMEEWSHAFDNNNQILAIFFDFAKAFDLVEHEHMLTKFIKKKYLPDWLISWLAAYLAKRKQRVVVGDIKTEWKQVEAGVIQGSVLGPVLFILFIHDINEYMPENIDIKKYADDILNYIIGKDLSAELPQKIVDAVQRWCIDNKMQLNIGKCKIMMVSKYPTVAPPVYINNTPLEAVVSYKYLGIEINNKIEWDHQWTRVRDQTRSVPYLLKRLKYLGFKQEILINVFRSHVLSHYIYSAPLLISAREPVRREMSSQIKRMLRIINITPEKAEKDYNIKDISKFIDETCSKVLKRLLVNPNSQITSKLDRVNRTRSDFIFKPSKFKTIAYRDSFVQKALRTIRDNGKTNLYISKTSNNKPAKAKQKPTLNTTSTTSEKTSVPSFQCPHCSHKPFKSQKWLSNHIGNKHPTTTSH
jgi:hypothetical protein